jgi:hypothetical protein
MAAARATHNRSRNELMAAAAYCDVVVTEKQLANLLKGSFRY